MRFPQDHDNDRGVVRIFGGCLLSNRRSNLVVPPRPPSLAFGVCVGSPDVSDRRCEVTLINPVAICGSTYGAIELSNSDAMCARLSTGLSTEQARQISLRIVAPQVIRILGGTKMMKGEELCKCLLEAGIDDFDGAETPYKLWTEDELETLRRVGDTRLCGAQHTQQTYQVRKSALFFHFSECTKITYLGLEQKWQSFVVLLGL